MINDQVWIISLWVEFVNTVDGWKYELLFVVVEKREIKRELQLHQEQINTGKTKR